MPQAALKLSVSLWSADLTNLATEIQRVDPYADLYHLDVADGTYAKLLLFFPDLVKSIRTKTSKPLEVHLITQNPERWVSSFAEAGADRVIFYPDTTNDIQGMIDAVKSHNMSVGISLSVENPVSFVQPYLEQLAIVCILGTGFDVKGINDTAMGTCEKIHDLVELRKDKGLDFEIEADGAIRRHTVPKLRQAGADIVVPGSLIFCPEMKENSAWLQSL
jgi:ribulose-phosphate 3-epimerase